MVATEKMSLYSSWNHYFSRTSHKCALCPLSGEGSSLYPCWNAWAPLLGLDREGWRWFLLLLPLSGDRGRIIYFSKLSFDAIILSCLLLRKGLTDCSWSSPLFTRCCGGVYVRPDLIRFGLGIRWPSTTALRFAILFCRRMALVDCSCI